MCGCRLTCQTCKTHYQPVGLLSFLILRPPQNCIWACFSEKWSYWGCTSSPDSNSPANKRWVTWNALTCLGDKNILAWVFIPSVCLRVSFSFNRNPKSIVVYDPALLSPICEAHRSCFVRLGRLEYCSTTFCITHLVIVLVSWDIS